jgi:hypothetical protein
MKMYFLVQKTKKFNAYKFKTEIDPREEINELRQEINDLKKLLKDKVF